MNVCGVTFGGYLAKILSFKTGHLLNNSKFHLLSEGTVRLGNRSPGIAFILKPQAQDVQGTCIMSSV